MIVTLEKEKEFLAYSIKVLDPVDHNFLLALLTRTQSAANPGSEYYQQVGNLLNKIISIQS